MLRKIARIIIFINTINILYSQTNNIDFLKEELQKTHNTKEKISIYNRLSLEYMFFDNVKSVEYANKALEYNNDEIIEERIRSLLLIGFNESYEDFLMVSDKIEEANRIIKLRNIKDKNILAFSYYITGASSIYTDRKSNAFDLIIKAHDIYFKLDNYTMYNLTKSSLATLHIELGQYNKAESIMKEALDYFQTIDHKKYILLSKRKLAYIYELSDNLDLAEELYLETINEAMTSYQLLLPYTVNSAIVYYLNRDKPNYALELYNTYLKDNLDSIPELEKVYIYKNLITIETMLKNYQNAIKYSKIAVKLDINNKYLLNELKNSTAYAYLKLKDYNASKSILLEVWDSIEKEDYSYIMFNNLTYLQELYSKTGENDELHNVTNNHLKKLQAYNSSVTYKTLIAAEEKFQISQRDQEINIIKRQKKFRTVSLVIISILLILIIIGIIIQLRTTRRDKIIFENMARTDFLTNLFNRRTFLEKVEEENIRFQRSGNWYSIILGDIDNFKLYNDKYGHECGDEIIKATSTVLKHTCRKQDTVARWGGEEFIILLPSTSITGARVIAERLKEKLNKLELSYKNQNLKVSMTFGLSEYNSDTNTDQLIHNADIALLHGKHSGKNVVISYNDVKDLKSL